MVGSGDSGNQVAGNAIHQDGKSGVEIRRTFPSIATKGLFQLYSEVNLHLPTSQNDNARPSETIYLPFQFTRNTEFFYKMRENKIKKKYHVVRFLKKQKQTNENLNTQKPEQH